MNFIGRFGVIEVILFLATPWLLTKVPIKYPTDYHPLIVWSLLNVVFVTANVRQGLGSAMTAGVVVIVLVGGTALAGALWKTDLAVSPGKRRERRE